MHTREGDNVVGGGRFHSLSNVCLTVFVVKDGSISLLLLASSPSTTMLPRSASFFLSQRRCCLGDNEAVPRNA